MEKAWGAKKTQLDRNRIYFPEGPTEKLKAIELKIIATNVECEDRLGQACAPSPSWGRSRHVRADELRTENGPRMDELQKLVRHRLWSASTTTESNR